MSTKKSFKRSEPALAFLSETSEGLEATPPKARASEAIPKGYKPNPAYIETKSRRVQALVQPSVYEAVKAKASSLGISTNEAINEALRQYTEA